MKRILLVLATLYLSGCTHYVPQHWEAHPTTACKENVYVSTCIEPKFMEYEDAFNHFILTIKNKTDKVIELNWNKTNFISEGMSNGGFIFDGVMYKDKNMQKQPDFIFANSAYSKSIYPANLTQLGSTWSFNPMPAGENGIFITFVIDGKEVQEKITTKMLTVLDPN